MTWRRGHQREHVVGDDVAFEGGEVREVLLGLELEGRRAARHGDRLCLESGEEVGVVTSGTFAPSLGKSIAFAWCRAGQEGAASFVIDNGRIIEEGTPDELFDHPKSERVKQFLGKILNH